jgi:hypothetical protein
MAGSSASVTEKWVGLSFGIASHFTLVRLSQADDSPLLAAGNEHQKIQPIAHVAKTRDAVLTIVLALIWPCPRQIS